MVAMSSRSDISVEWVSDRLLLAPKNCSDVRGKYPTSKRSVGGIVQAEAVGERVVAL